MEKIVEPEVLKLYISQRDDILKVVAEDVCRGCAHPQKYEMEINYKDPLNCECRCSRVNNILASAANLDKDIKMMSIQN